MAEFSISYFKQIVKYESNSEMLPPLANLRDLFYKLTTLAMADDDGVKMLRFLLFRTLKNSLVRESKEPDADKYELVVLREVFEGLRKSGFSVYDIWTWDAGFWEGFIVTDSRRIKGTLIIAYRDQIQELVLHQDSSNEYGVFLSNLTNLLFPRVKLTVWFDLLTFINWRAYSRLNNKSDLYSRIVDWCKYRRGFGMTDGYRRFGGDYSFYGKNKDTIDQVFEKMIKEDNEDFRETIYLLKKICGLSFDLDSCRAILGEIAKIKNDGVFDNNSYESAKLSELESHIKRIAELLKHFNWPWWNNEDKEDNEEDEGNNKSDDDDDADENDDRKTDID